MTCRHAKGDPACTSTAGGWAWKQEQEITRTYSSRNQDSYMPQTLLTPPATPTPTFEIKVIEQVGSLLVLQISYPSCPDCTYEGLKTLVVEATIKDALFWRKADPHFRAGPFQKNEMPSPIVRFPGTPAGLEEAMRYASWKKSQ